MSVYDAGEVCFEVALLGRLVEKIEHQSGIEILLRRNGLLDGVYVVQMVEGRKMMGKWRVVVGE